jgi:hypothetical protein
MQSKLHKCQDVYGRTLLKFKLLQKPAVYRLESLTQNIEDARFLTAVTVCRLFNRKCGEDLTQEIRFTNI